MFEFLRRLMDESDFVPRAVCGNWTRGEVWLNNVSDLFIALAYVMIPVILVYFARRRGDLPFSWLFVVFGAFIVTCGCTHVIEIILFYHPVYRLAGLVKLLTAVASWGALLALMRVTPLALSLRSPRELELLNRELAAEVNHRRQAEAELAEKNLRLQESERLKDQFLATVSHELRTPLTLILSPVETLLSQSDSALMPGQRAALEMVRANSVRLLQQVNDLLDFSRFSAGRLEIHRESTPLAGFTGSLVAAFQPLAEERGIELRYHRPGEQSRLMDHYLYERIVFNLLSNALKFTSWGGRVEVHLEMRDEICRLTVEDDGQGIPEADLPTLFERFRQASNTVAARKPGTGLGLALVREFSSVLGGGVTVWTQLGQGSTFLVQLLAPASSLPAEAPVQRTAVPTTTLLPASGTESHGGFRARILIAEDNPELASYMSTVLRGLAQVEVVRDGQQAWESVRSQPPELLLSDVMMPQLSGFQLCRKVKEDPDLANVAVVLITALTHREALLEGWEAGADEFLFKPFHPTELITRVRSLVSNARARRELEAGLRDLNAVLEQRVEERNRELLQRWNELEAALAAAKRANRAKAVFLGNLSHELRTPLTGILGISEMLLQGALEESLRAEIHNIRQSARGLDGLLQDLLEFSQMEVQQLKLRPTNFDLADLLDQVRSAMALEARERKLELQVDAPEQSWLQGDASRLRHVLLNLVANALKFTETGFVALTCESPGGARPGHVRLRFSVLDSGIGIAAEDQQRIFEPFSQVDPTLSRRRQGAGLGLAISRELVALMGGELRVESEPGRGSRFFFEVELAQGAFPGQPPAVQRVRPARILLVEDNLLNRKMLQLMLERTGYEVTTAELAREGMELYQALTFDLVLLDLQLPDLDGIEAARRMLQRPGPHPPFVALTAHAGEEYRQQCLAVGMSEFLTKPFEAETLLAALRRILDK